MIKQAFAATVLAAATMSAQAGVVINEGFDSVSSLSSSGWIFTNASTPGGVTTGWYQGTSGVFEAQAGASTSYAAANYNNTVEGGTISSWLITPEFDATNGVNISFYLRAAGEGYADQIAYGFTAGTGAMTYVTAVPDSGWTLYTVYLAPSTLGVTRFAFEYLGTYDTANYVGLDSLTVAVPEPASLALFAVGLLGLGTLRRRVRS
jgi:hypothetical protein